MKTLQNKFKTILLLLLVGFAFTSCSSDDDSNSNPGEDTGGNDMVATIVLESGEEVDFSYNFPNINFSKPTISHEGGDEYVLSIAASADSNYSIGITGVINNEEGSYSYLDEDDDETGVSINLTKIEGDNIDIFAPVVVTDNLIGSAELTITSLTENHIKASFSATLYSTTTGEKAIIKNGKLNSELYRHEVE